MEGICFIGPDRRGFSDEIDNVGDVVNLLARLRALAGDGLVSSLSIIGDGVYLDVAEVGNSRVSLMYAASNGDWSFASIDPEIHDDDDASYWFLYHGDASEIPARMAIREDLAMLAVAQYLHHPEVMPQVDGFVWEQD